MNWDSFLEAPTGNAHFVQLYTDEASLTRNVAHYLFEGFERGDCGVVICTPAHRKAFSSALAVHGVDLRTKEQDGDLLFLDASITLDRFMINGQPDWVRFESVIGEAVRSARGQANRGIRAYGEMVGLLWTSGEYSAAIRLEEYWNRILASLGATLFCSYPIDVFGAEFEQTSVHAILCDHTHLLPDGDSAALEESLNWALQKVLGARGEEISKRMKSKTLPQWGAVPRPEGKILWLREYLPGLAGQILSEAKERYIGHQTGDHC